MTIPDEKEPVTVSEGTKQMGETRPIEWDWVERSVWTDRMLEALETGVKGGVWFSLIDKVYRPTTLYAAWLAVKANKGSAGSDRQSIKDFERNLSDNFPDCSKRFKQAAIGHDPSGEST